MEEGRPRTPFRHLAALGASQRVIFNFGENQVNTRANPAKTAMRVSQTPG